MVTKVRFICLCCGKEAVGVKNKGELPKYCSLSCQHEFQNREYISRWLAGEEKGWTGKTAGLVKTIRRWLHETRGTACEECGWDKKHPVDGAVLTEVDHIDGDAHNCNVENLKILCPNCHSMTPTFRARNRESKRIRNSPI